MTKTILKYRLVRVELWKSICWERFLELVKCNKRTPISLTIHEGVLRVSPEWIVDHVCLAGGMKLIHFESESFEWDVGDRSWSSNELLLISLLLYCILMCLIQLSCLIKTIKYKVTIFFKLQVLKRQVKSYSS